MDTPPLNHIGLWVDDLEAAVKHLTASGVRFTPGGIRKGAAGHNVVFIHPKVRVSPPLSLPAAPRSPGRSVGQGRLFVWLSAGSTGVPRSEYDRMHAHMNTGLGVRYLGTMHTNECV